MKLWCYVFSLYRQESCCPLSKYLYLVSHGKNMFPFQFNFRHHLFTLSLPVLKSLEFFHFLFAMSLLKHIYGCRQEILLLDNEIAFNEAIIEEREQGLREIEEQIGEANEIFKDLAVLVHEQGVVIGKMLDTKSINIFVSYSTILLTTSGAF